MFKGDERLDERALDKLLPGLRVSDRRGCDTIRRYPQDAGTGAAHCLIRLGVSNDVARCGGGWANWTPSPMGCETGIGRTTVPSSS